MSPPTGITRDQAAAHLGVLHLLLSMPGLDLDTERRARWLKLRLNEIIPEEKLTFDFMDARIALLLPEEGAQRAAA